MSDLQEKKKQPARYPLGTIKQAKGTIARLARDVLNKKIPVNEARAAAYIISQLVQVFKIETPEKKDIDISIGSNNWIIEMTPEERNRKLQELLKKSMPFYDDYLLYANRKADEVTSKKMQPVEIDGVEKLIEFEDQMAWITAEGESHKSEMERIMDAAHKAENEEKKTEETTAWKPRGIGAKRT